MKLFLSFLVLSMSAYVFADRAERREQRQEARIQQGVESGALNTQETARLNAGQERVDNAQAAAAADGAVTGAEKARIEKMQDRQNRRIRRLKHNNR